MANQWECPKCGNPETTLDHEAIWGGPEKVKCSKCGYWYFHVQRRDDE